ncbi:MAG: paraquat-inducible protein A [Thiotrichales bacterium]|nr:MAG: paraquat-inducible protein A [Thiotrichales bacterium]
MANSSYGLAGTYPVESRILLGLLLVTTVCLAVGLLAPVLTLEKFFIINNTFSIYSGLVQLLREGRIFLFIIILLFSVLLPVIKLVVLFRLLGSKAASSESLRRLLHLMHQYGKWSMLDVFVVALLVVAVKLGAVASVQTHYGLYAFGTAVLLTMAITARVIHLAAHIENQA